MASASGLQQEGVSCLCGSGESMVPYATNDFSELPSRQSGADVTPSFALFLFLLCIVFT